jgi:hypothetical protein
MQPSLQAELSKQRWLLNLVLGIEKHHEDVVLDLHEERVCARSASFQKSQQSAWKCDVGNGL